jgi:S-DNA-T family DNA segregation ATPase FtsK/SpoIIIE
MVLAPIGGVLVMGVAMGLVYHNYIYPVIIASASMVYPVVMVLRQRDQDRRYRDEKERIQKAYERRMGEVEDELNRLRQRQSECLTSTYPTVEEILEWARQVSTRLWERRPDEPDFLEIRLGLGSVPASYRVKVPQVDFPELAPPLMLQAAETAETFRYVPDMPITVHLQDQGSLAVTGPRPWREGMARTILSQIAGLHSPDEVDLYAVYPADKAEDWAWLKWLPHARALRGGGRHHLAYDPVSVRQVLSGVMDELETRQVR